eukprot:CAMPEP_0173428320 /NCGR_PEP_ID=MMETSP1357-20121228/7278_1 /TAXON_ID=77926 /ORGANISM="Hemiselmis rufescens, Strain PCC563" /LENGTH=111 /DNA_ID=CAMNT_0014392307 /DNA_START=417 /DNA_END=752 /DNA_ORIENTATION=+
MAETPEGHPTPFALITQRGVDKMLQLSTRVRREARRLVEGFTPLWRAVGDTRFATEPPATSHSSGGEDVRDQDIEGVNVVQAPPFSHASPPAHELDYGPSGAKKATKESAV